MDTEKGDEKPAANPQEAVSLENPETVIEPATAAAETGTASKSPSEAPSGGRSAKSTSSPSGPAVTSNKAAGTPGGGPGGSSYSSNGPSEKRTFRQRVRDFLARFNLYLLAFILIILIAVIAIVVTTLQVHKNSTKSNNINNQNLSQGALQQLSNSDATVGTSNQTLNVQSNAIFAGQVVLRSNLEVAGTIKAGGSLSLPGLTVSGTSTFAQLQTASLAVSSDTVIQGSLNVQKNISAGGTGSFGALSAQQLSVGSLQLNGALVLTSHITAGGPVPRKSDGNALGIGGTSSVSGSDTAGSIDINTGSSPAAGCFIVVTFAQAYAGTPRVLLTPTSSAAAGIPYYVTRTGTNFSVCTAAPAASGQNISFDYAVFD